MHSFDDVGFRDLEQFIVALQVLALPMLEAFPAEIGLPQFKALDHRPHRAIDDSDPLLEQFNELVATVKCHMRLNPGG